MGATGTRPDGARSARGARRPARVRALALEGRRTRLAWPCLTPVGMLRVPAGFAGAMDATRRRWTMLAVILGSGIVFLDSTVVNVALPRIGQDLSSRFFDTLEAQSYVYSGYLLTLSALLILGGALADFYGRRRV